MLKKFTIFVSLATTITVLDQISKHWIIKHLGFQESFSVFRPVFSITYIRNTGAAFGLFRDAPLWFRGPFFTFVPLVALSVLFVVLIFTPKKEKGTLVGLSLIFGGAIGNLMDRLTFGYVVDFLDFYWKGNHWPAFNVADSSVVCGVAILFICSLFQEKIQEPAGEKPLEARSELVRQVGNDG